MSSPVKVDTAGLPRAALASSRPPAREQSRGHTAAVISGGLAPAHSLPLALPATGHISYVLVQCSNRRPEALAPLGRPPVCPQEPTAPERARHSRCAQRGPQGLPTGRPKGSAPAGLPAGPVSRPAGGSPEAAREGLPRGGSSGRPPTWRPPLPHHAVTIGLGSAPPRNPRSHSTFHSSPRASHARPGLGAVTAR